MWKKLGRGLGFVEDIFKHNFHPSYKLCINFFFELRNVAVHNSNIADKELCEVAESEFINCDRKIKAGDKVEWSLLSALQLNQLVVQIMDEVDNVICSPLNLETTSGHLNWYYLGK